MKKTTLQYSLMVSAFIGGILLLAPAACSGDLNSEDAGACMTGVCAGTICVPGSVELCYSGPEGTLGVGACRPGKKTCNDRGTSFGPCIGEVLVQPESCNGMDDDCDGTVDKGLLGHGAACAGASCKDILLAGASVGDSAYWIVPGGAQHAVEVQCDMTTDGGGWTLAGNWYYADNTTGEQWISGLGAGTIYAAKDKTFKMPDVWIRALAGDRYRVQAAGTACNHGIDMNSCNSGDIPNYTRFWGPDCAYDSTLNQISCDKAYVDVNLTKPAPTSPMPACAWHHGLLSAMGCPAADVQEVITDHSINFFGPAVCVGLKYKNACAILENALLRIWVR